MPPDSDISLIESISLSWPTGRWREFNVVVAVSGGADSVALLRALNQIKDEASLGNLIVAHFNHKLRGADSDGDADFVRKLAKDLGLEFRSGVADGATSERKPGSEESFRDARYEFLFEVARDTGSRYIATAHHRDDQIETVLFRLFRGTGVAGLSGIPVTRVVDESLTIVRPMLHVSRTAIESALKQWNQPTRHDTSNAESSYARNFLRNDVLPLLRQRFGSVDDAVARLASQAAEQQEFIREQMFPLFDSVLIEEGDVTIDCGRLGELSPVLIRELFREIFRQQSWPVSQLGFRELDRLAQLVRSDSDEPRFQLPGAINCLKHEGVVRLSQ